MAQTNHVEGDVGFYLCTDPGDAEYFALMRRPGTIIEFVLSDEAWFELSNEGIVVRPYPSGE